MCGRNANAAQRNAKPVAIQQEGGRVTAAAKPVSAASLLRLARQAEAAPDAVAVLHAMMVALAIVVAPPVVTVVVGADGGIRGIVRPCREGQRGGNRH